MIKDILQTVEFPLDGIDLENPPEDLLQKFKTHFEEKLIFKSVAHEDSDIVKKIVGKRAGEMETHAKQQLKSVSDILGKEVFGENDLKDKKFEEIVSLGIERIKDNIKEIKESANKTDDKKLQKLQDDLDARIKEYKTLQENFDAVAVERDELSNSFESFKINTQVDTLRKNELSKVQFSETVDEYWKKGFFNDVDSELKMVLDNDNDLGYKVINTKTNETILDGSKPKAYYKIIEERLQEAGKLKVSNGQEKKEKSVYTPSINGESKDKTFAQLRAEENLAKIRQAQTS